jgi:hypothetical protein
VSTAMARASRIQLATVSSSVLTAIGRGYADYAAGSDVAVTAAFIASRWR